IPASGGEVIIPGEREQMLYNDYRFAAARRVGDTLYVSGVIVARAPNEGTDVAAFKEQCRRAFKRLQATLTASGVSFAEVVMITSYHVFQAPNFTATREEQFEAFTAVKDEFMPNPYPAWTAVGTTGLLADTGIVEIQLIAHIPSK